MEPGKLIVGLLVFVTMILAGTMMIIDINSNYASSGVDMDTENYVNMTSLAYDAYYNTSSQGKDGMEKVFVPLEGEATESSMFKAGFSSLRLIASTPTLIYNIVNSAAIELRVPSIFVGIFFTALTIMLMFSIIYIVFRIAKG